MSPAAPVLNNVFGEENAHRNRKSTIVMDGKANGELVLIWWRDVIKIIRQ